MISMDIVHSYYTAYIILWKLSKTEKSMFGKLSGVIVALLAMPFAATFLLVLLLLLLVATVAFLTIALVFIAVPLMIFVFTILMAVLVMVLSLPDMRSFKGSWQFCVTC